MIDTLGDNGYTGEEMKMHNETRRILGSDQLAVNATAVRVPDFYGHGEAVHLETAEALEVERARELLAATSGIRVIEDKIGRASCREGVERRGGGGGGQGEV